MHMYYGTGAMHILWGKWYWSIVAYPCPLLWKVNFAPKSTQSCYNYSYSLGCLSIMICCISKIYMLIMQYMWFDYPYLYEWFITIKHFNIPHISSWNNNIFVRNKCENKQKNRPLFVWKARTWARIDMKLIRPCIIVFVLLHSQL